VATSQAGRLPSQLQGLITDRVAACDVDEARELWRWSAGLARWRSIGPEDDTSVVGHLGLAVRRAIAQRFLTAATACALAFSVGVLAAGPIYAAGAEQAIVYAYMRTANPLAKDTFVSLLTWPGFDLPNASQRVRSGLAPLHISQLTLQEESGNSVVSLGRRSGVAPIAYRDGLFGKLPLVEGRNPSKPGEVLVPQLLAAALGLAPGARISLSHNAVTHATVSGVYWSARGKDPLVYADHRLLSNPSHAPLLTTRAGFAALTHSFGQTSDIAIEWDAEPSSSGLTVADLKTLAPREQQSSARIRATLGGTTVSSDLSSLIPGAERAVTAGLAPIYVIAAEVALVGLGVLLGIGLLKLERQSFELAVLATRGARTGELAAMQAAEAAIAAIAALPVSLLAALGLALVARAAHGPALPGTPFPIGLNTPAVQVALGGVILGASALVLVSLPRLRHTVLQERQRLSRTRRGIWARLPYEIVPLLLGAAALTELHRHHLGGHGTGLDPLAVGAPTLLLLGVAALAARLLLAGARRLDRVTNTVREPSAYLALRRLSRSGSTAWLALLLVLSAALFAFATTLRTTELTRNQTAARAQVGADWSLSVGWPAQGVASADRLGSAATLAFYGSAAASSVPALSLATVIGVDPASYAGAGWWQARDANLPLPSLLSRLSDPALGMALPHGAQMLQLRVSASTGKGLHLWAVLSSPDGMLFDRSLGVLQPGTATYRARILGASRLLSVMVSGSPQAVAPLFRHPRVRLVFSRLVLSGGGAERAIDVSAWRGLQAGATTVGVTPRGAGELQAALTVSQGGSLGGIAPASQPMPILVGGVGPGRVPRDATLQVGSVVLPARVAGTMNAFPAATERGLPFAVAPVRALIERFQQARQPPGGGVFAVLSMGDGSPVALTRRAGLQVTAVSSAAAIEAQLASHQENLAIGIEFAAAIAGVALAMLALVLSAYFGGRRYEYEAASFEALGAKLGTVVSTLAFEYGAVVLCSAAVGMGVGLGLLAVTFSYVTSSAGGPAVPGLLVDWPVIAAAAAVAAASLSGTLLVAAMRIRRLSPVAILRGEPE
jgi:FtsX-like permease family protein